MLESKLIEGFTDDAIHLGSYPGSPLTSPLDRSSHDLVFGGSNHGPKGAMAGLSSYAAALKLGSSNSLAQMADSLDTALDQMPNYTKSPGRATHTGGVSGKGGKSNSDLSGLQTIGSPLSSRSRGNSFTDFTLRSNDLWLPPQVSHQHTHEHNALSPTSYPLAQSPRTSYESLLSKYDVYQDKSMLLLSSNVSSRKPSNSISRPVTSKQFFDCVRHTNSTPSASSTQAQAQQGQHGQQGQQQQQQLALPIPIQNPSIAYNNSIGNSPTQNDFYTGSLGSSYQPFEPSSSPMFMSPYMYTHPLSPAAQPSFSFTTNLPPLDLDRPSPGGLNGSTESSNPYPSQQQKQQLAVVPSHSAWSDIVAKSETSGKAPSVPYYPPSSPSGALLFMGPIGDRVRKMSNSGQCCI